MGRQITLVLRVDDKGTAQVARFADSLEKETKQAAKAAERAVARLQQRIGRSMDRAADRFLRFGAIATTVVGGLAARAVIRFGSDFGRTMSGVRAVTGAAGDEFDLLSEKAKEMGRTTVFSATQSAEAMEKMGLAGFESTEILASLPDVLSLAAAGSLGMAEAASIASDVMRGMGVEAREFGHAADVIAAAAANANQTVADLGSSFRFVAPVARAAGVKFEETAAAVSVLANRGIRAEMAGTGLRRMLSVMMGNLEEGEAGLAGLNLKLFDSEGRFVGVAAAIEQMKAAGIRNNEVMKAFGQRAGPAVLALLQAGSGELRRFTEMLEKSQGAAAEMAETRLDNLAGDMTLLRSASEGLALAIFDQLVPALRESTQRMTGLVQGGVKLVETTNVLRGIGRVAALAGLAFAAMVGAGLFRKLKAFILRLREIRVALLATRAEAMSTGFAFQDMARKAAGAERSMIAMSGGIAAISAEAVLAIAEITGLDQKIADAIAGANDTVEESANRFGAQIGFIERVLNKAGAEGLGDGFIPKEALDRAHKLQETAEKFADAGIWTHVAEEARAELVKMGADLQKAEKFAREFHKAMLEALKVAPDLWARAAEETDNAAAQLARYNELLAERRKGEQAAAEEARRASAEEKQALEAVRKTVEKAVLSSGRVSDKMFANLLEHWERVRKVAEQQQIPDSVIARAFEGDLAKVQEVIDTTGRSVTGWLGDLLAMFNALREQKIQAKALEDLQDELLRLGHVSQKTATQIQAGILRSIRALSMEAGGKNALALFAAASADELLRLGYAAKRTGVKLDPLVEAAIESAEAFKATEKRAEGLKKRLTDLAAFAATATLQGATEQLGRSLADSFGVAQQAGIEYLDVLRFHREELDQLIDRYRFWGEELPPWLAEASEALERLGDQEALRQLVADLNEGFVQLREQGIRGVADALAGAIAYGRDLGESLRRAFQQILAQGISMLVQFGLQRLLLGKVITGATAAEAGSGMAKAMGEVYANTFASISAIPIVGPAMAPEAAAAAVGVATAGATASAATGSGVGVGMIPQLAEGGIAQRRAVVEIGERGREAVVPLRGEPARRAARELGIGQPRGVVISDGAVQITVGSIDSTDRVTQIAEEVRDALADLILAGRVQPLPAGVR